LRPIPYETFNEIFLLAVATLPSYFLAVEAYFWGIFSGVERKSERLIYCRESDGWAIGEKCSYMFSG